MGQGGPGAAGREERGGKGGPLPPWSWGTPPGSLEQPSSFARVRRPFAAVSLTM